MASYIQCIELYTTETHIIQYTKQCNIYGLNKKTKNNIYIQVTNTHTYEHTHSDQIWNMVMALKSHSQAAIYNNSPFLKWTHQPTTASIAANITMYRTSVPHITVTFLCKTKRRYGHIYNYAENHGKMVTKPNEIPLKLKY